MPTSITTTLMALGLVTAIAVGWPGIIAAGLGALWELAITLYASANAA